MSTIPEIIVKGKKGQAGKPVVDPSLLGQSTYYDTFERDVDTLDAQEAMQDAAAAGALYAAEKQVMEEIIAKGKKVATKTAPKIDDLSAFLPKTKYLPVLYKEPVMPEIKVIAKKLPKLTGLARAALPLSVAEVLGYLTKNILREAGRQAFEELGQKVTRTIPARPDTAVKTIQETQEETLIPEIIATAKRRPRPAQLAERVEIDMLSDWFNREMLRNTFRESMSSSDVSLATNIATPTIPRTRTRTLTDALIASQTMNLTEPTTTQTRSQMLGIGTQTGTTVAQRLASSTGVGTAIGASVIALPITQTQLTTKTPVGQKTKYCTPCPRRKPKRRKKCYRQLVKQGLYPKRDKVSKWAQIDCVTGKTIKELI